MSWRLTSPRNSGKRTQRLEKCPAKSVARARPRSSMGRVASLQAPRVSSYSFCQQFPRRTHFRQTRSAVREKISEGSWGLTSWGDKVSFTLSERVWKAPAISSIRKTTRCRVWSSSPEARARTLLPRSWSFSRPQGRNRKRRPPRRASTGKPTRSPPSQVHKAPTVTARR